MSEDYYEKNGEKYDKETDERIIKQNGKTYRENWLGNWVPETDWKGDPRIETDWKGDPKIETDWKGDPIVKSDKSDSICFISTACIKSQGLPNDCEELNCLRHFRDEFVSNLPNGDELVKEYYEVAPKIVSAINRTKSPKKIYSILFEELVSETVRLINSNQKQGAFSNCVSIVRDLERKYLR